MRTALIRLAILVVLAIAAFFFWPKKEEEAIPENIIIPPAPAPAPTTTTGTTTTIKETTKILVNGEEEPTLTSKIKIDAFSPYEYNNFTNPVLNLFPLKLGDSSTDDLAGQLIEVVQHSINAKIKLSGLKYMPVNITRNMDLQTIDRLGKLAGVNQVSFELYKKMADCVRLQKITW
jgi:hypothetical protein